MAIGVLTDNTVTGGGGGGVAVDYFKNRIGNGAINNAVTNTVAESNAIIAIVHGQEEGLD